MLADQGPIKIPVDGTTVTQHPGLLTSAIAGFGLHAEHLLLQLTWYLAILWVLYFIFLRPKTRAARPAVRGPKKAQ